MRQVTNWPRFGRTHNFPVMRGWEAKRTGARILLFLTVASLTACGGQERSTAAARRSEHARPDTGPPTAVTVPTEYDEELLFYSTEDGPATALALDLSNYASFDGLHRRYQGWLLDRTRWRSILDGESRDASTRAPWRILPTDTLQLVVSDDGEIDSFIFRPEATPFTLHLGDRVERWEDRGGARHELRWGQLSRRGDQLNGIVVQHRFAIEQPAKPGSYRPMETAILKTREGTLLALFDSGEPEALGQSFAWMYDDGLTRHWSAIETRTVEVANAPDLRRNIPIRIWFRVPEPDIKGELTATARLLEGTSTERGPRPYVGLYRVSGWVEFGGERRNVEGVMQHSEP